jgi:hypothetical protein
MKKTELILKELDHLVETTLFKTKPLQKKFIQYFARLYRESGEIVPVTNDDLVAIYASEEAEFENDGDKFLRKKNVVSKHIGELRDNLKKFYQGPGTERPHVIAIPKNEHGKYTLDVLIRQSKKAVRERPSKMVGGPVPALSGANNTRPALCSQSVTESILLILKGVDRKRLIQVQRGVLGIMWSSSLIGLSVLIVLLIGIPHWPAMPLMGLSLAGLLTICTCIAVLARPITRLADVPFRRWWGNSFCLYRGEALILAQYFGRCTVDGCQGDLSIVQEGHERTNIFHPLSRRWIIVCKNVPMEHPRTPFDFTALDRVRASNGLAKPELPRTA